MSLHEYAIINNVQKFFDLIGEISTTIMHHVHSISLHLQCAANH